jgi:hypothetical protein
MSDWLSKPETSFQYFRPRESRRRRFRTIPLPQPRPDWKGMKGAGVRHGTQTGYIYGCGCDPCWRAHIEEQRDYRRRKSLVVAPPEF